MGGRRGVCRDNLAFRLFVSAAAIWGRFLGRVLLLGRLLGVMALLLLVGWGLLSRMFKLLLRLRLGGIEGWLALEIIRVCHDWFESMFKLLLGMDGMEGWRTSEII